MEQVRKSSVLPTGLHDYACAYGASKKVKCLPTGLHDYACARCRQEDQVLCLAGFTVMHLRKAGYRKRVDMQGKHMIRNRKNGNLVGSKTWKALLRFLFFLIQLHNHYPLKAEINEDAALLKRMLDAHSKGSYNTHVSAHHLSCRIMSCLDCCIEVAALRAPQHVARQAHDLLAASSTASFVNPKQSPQVLHPDPHSTWP
eukprot:1157114-Pelagomonas_calceolata.AAC.5